MVRALGTEHSADPLHARRYRRDAFPTVIRHAERPILRTAPAPLLLLSRARPRQRLQGRADRRRRRRDLRRLRHLQGSEDPPLLGRASRSSKRRPLLFAAALSVPAGACRASRSAICEAFFATGLDATRRSALLAPAALPHDRRRQAVLLGGSARGSSAATMRSTSCAPACPPISSAGTRCRRRSTSRPPTCCPATSCRRRATAWRWRMRSRAASRSSIIASSSSRRSIPPRLKLRGLREKHILREAMARHAAARRSATRPKQPYRAPDSQSLRRRSAPAYVGELLSAAEAIAAGGLLRCRARCEKLVAKCAAQPLTGFRDNVAFVGILSTQLLASRHSSPDAARRARSDRSPDGGLNRREARTMARRNRTAASAVHRDNFLFRDDRDALARRRVAARRRR